MRKTVAIYLSEDYFSGDIITFREKHYSDAYHDLITRILELGADVIIARNAKTNYISGFTFTSYFRAEKVGDGIKFTEENQPREFDILLDKGHFPFDIARKINPRIIDKICFNKYSSYLFAPEFHAQTYLIEDSEHLDALRAGGSSKKTVLKELSGSGGSGVFIGEMSEYDGELSFPLIAQDFIDTSRGSSGLTDGVHDVRVALFNGEPIYGLLREPPKGGLISNLSYGGRIRALYLSEIPLEIINLAIEIDRKFNMVEPRFFSTDWGFDGKNWKLFEMNSHTGFVSRDVIGDAADWYLQNVAEKLVESANSYEK